MSTQNKLVACFLALCVPGFSQSLALPHKKADWNNVTALARAAEVRVQLSDSRSVRGGVINVTEDSLAVNSASGQETFTRQQVLRVSVRGPSRRGRNVLVGLAFGAIAGAGLGAAAAASQPCSPGLANALACSGGVEAAAVGITTLAGAGLGAVIGAVVPTGGWREVYRQ
jgi:hypothetical protein